MHSGGDRRSLNETPELDTARHPDSKRLMKRDHCGRGFSSSSWFAAKVYAAATAAESNTDQAIKTDLCPGYLLRLTFNQ